MKGIAAGRSLGAVPIFCWGNWNMMSDYYMSVLLRSQRSVGTYAHDYLILETLHAYANNEVFSFCLILT